MKNISLALLITSVILTFISCDNDSLNLTPKAIVNNPKEFLKEVKSDNLAEFFISGEFDGISIYCASTFADINTYNDTSFNALYVNSTGLDQINLVRQNHERTIKIAFYFLESKIFTREFPYKLPHENLIAGEFAQIELINMRKLGTAVQSSLEDDFSFWGSSFNSVIIQVTSFTNNIMEGTFEGSLTTINQYSRIIVKNGKFRIKIKVINLDK